MSLPRHLLLPSALFCALLWGSAFPGIKFIYREWPESQAWDTRLLLAGVRFMIAGLLLVPVAGWRGYTNRVGGASRLRLMELTLGQTVGQYLFFYTGLALSSGVLGALLNASGSFWWILLAPLLLKTPRPGSRHWITLLVCTAGMVFAVYRPGAGSGSPVAGAACFLASSLCGVLGIIAQTRLKGSLDTRTATSFSLGTGGIILTLSGVTAWDQFEGLLQPRIALMTVYLACVSAAAFALWNRLARDFSVNLLAGYRFLIPLAGVALAVLFIPDESPGLGIWVGGALVTTGLVYLNHLERPRGSPPS